MKISIPMLHVVSTVIFQVSISLYSLPWTHMLSYNCLSVLKILWQWSRMNFIGISAQIILHSKFSQETIINFYCGVHCSIGSFETITHVSLQEKNWYWKKWVCPRKWLPRGSQWNMICWIATTHNFVIPAKMLRCPQCSIGRIV